MPLTDTAIRKTKPEEKPIKLRDGGGLYLILRPDGARWWRLDYRRPLSGKRNTLSLGTYPDTGLAEARAERDRARKQLAAGIDPGEHRKAEQSAGAERASNSFEVISREWLAVKAHGWTESHHAKQRVRLEAHVLPWIGKKPITDVGVSDLRPLLNRMVERSHHEQAHRVMAAISSVFKYAVATERAE
ncbi:MAG TPA: integrase arm-type DNA-binding domain-containing protein, partial [Pseudoxanthomonas sp.]|nr:integrase arm-type DNA-binding domain-containing protein [Pseudoxanthomonas sp.]